MSSMLKRRIGWVEEEGPEEFRKKVGWPRDKVLNRTVLSISNSVQEGAKKDIRYIRRRTCGCRNVRTSSG
jgi:hypothetical protein